MFDQVKLIFESAAQDQELWDAIAQCLMAQQEAMVRAGFTYEQAFEYIKAQGMAVKQ